jgi:acetyl esterase/lipase
MSANDNRVPVKVHVFPGLPHGFRRFADLPSSRRWDELMIENIKWALGNPQANTGSELSLNVEEEVSEEKV